MAFTAEQKRIRRERAAAWNKAHPERVRLNHRAYYAAHRKKVAKYAKKYQAGHRVEAIATQKRFHSLRPWYYSWQGARQRCTNPTCPAYRYYGARGIRCRLSQADVRFMWVRDKAAQMDYPTIDRRDPRGDYALENCRFIEKWANSSRSFAGPAAA